MTIKSNKPRLRFKDELGQEYPCWKELQIRDIAEVTRGSGLSKSDLNPDGQRSCILYGELFTKYNVSIHRIHSFTDKRTSVIGEYGDILMPTSDVTPDGLATASALLLTGVQLGGDINIIRLCRGDHPVFVSYMLNFFKSKIVRLVSGTTVKHIYPRDIRSVKLVVPRSRLEQQKIADFLSTIDEKIEYLEKKRSLLKKYKHGIMQRLFRQELRFKDEDGITYPDWKETQLGSLGTTFNGLTGKTSTHFGHGRRYIQYLQIFENSKVNLQGCGFVEIGKDESQNEVRKGDVFFTISSETPEDVGVASVLLNDVRDTFLNSFCFGYRANHKKLLPEFARYAFRENSFRRSVVKLAQGSTRFNLSKTSLMKLTVSFPSIPEQKKISSHLSALDEKIDFLTKQIEKTRTFKQGLLQQLFV